MYLHPVEEKRRNEAKAEDERRDHHPNPQQHLPVDELVDLAWYLVDETRRFRVLVADERVVGVRALLGIVIGEVHFGSIGWLWVVGMPIGWYSW